MKQLITDFARFHTYYLLSSILDDLMNAALRKFFPLNEEGEDWDEDEDEF